VLFLDAVVQSSPYGRICVTFAAMTELKKSEEPGDTASSPPARTRRPWVRSVAAGALGVLAVLSVLLSTLTVWAESVLFDADSVATAAGDAVSDPAAISALASEITDQVFAALDVEQRLNDRLGELPGGLNGSVLGSAPISDLVVDGAGNVVQRAMTEALSAPVVRESVESAIRAAHGLLLKVLEGDSTVVTLDVVPIATLAISELQQFGLFTDVELPDFVANSERVGDVAAEIATLSDALGVQFPDTFGSLVVYRDAVVDNAATHVQAARDAVVMVRRIGAAILVLTVAMLVGTLLLARHRWRAVAVLVAGVAALAGFSRIVLSRVVNDVPDLISDHAIRLVVREFLASLTSGLSSTLAAMVLLSLATVVGVISAGRVPARRR